MAYGTVEMVTVDAYKGLRAGGIALAIIATVGMVAILTLNTAGAAHIPTGWTALAATGMMVAPVMFFSGKILRKMDDLIEHVAGIRALTAHHNVAQGAELVDPDDARVVRQAYANGAVDMLDGRATVIPMNPINGVRVSSRDQPR